MKKTWANGDLVLHAFDNGTLRVDDWLRYTYTLHPLSEDGRSYNADRTIRTGRIGDTSWRAQVNAR